MKTRMASTSLKAYDNLGDLKGKRLEVYNVIYEHGPVCNAEIAEILDWPINRVTGRTTELREMLKVEQSHKGLYKETGQQVIFWKAKLKDQRNPLKDTVAYKLMMEEPWDTVTAPSAPKPPEEDKPKAPPGSWEMFRQKKQEIEADHA